MNHFAALLDRLAYEPGRNAKLRLLTDYFRTTPDPDRGYALAAITGALSFRHAKPGLIRALIAERTDPTLFGLSYDYVGDLSETVALMWPAKSPGHEGGPLPGLRGGAREGARPTALTRWDGPLPDPPPQAREGEDEPTPAVSSIPDAGKLQALGPSLSEVVTTLAALGKTDLPAQLE